MTFDSKVIKILSPFFFMFALLIVLLGFLLNKRRLLIAEKLCVPRKNLIPFFIIFISSLFFINHDLFSYIGEMNERLKLYICIFFFSRYGERERKFFFIYFTIETDLFLRKKFTEFKNLYSSSIILLKIKFALRLCMNSSISSA